MMRMQATDCLGDLQKLMPESNSLLWVSRGWDRPEVLLKVAFICILQNNAKCFSEAEATKEADHAWRRPHASFGNLIECCRLADMIALRVSTIECLDSITAARLDRGRH